MGDHLFLRQQPGGSPSAAVQSVGNQTLCCAREPQCASRVGKISIEEAPPVQMVGRSFHFVTIQQQKKKPLYAFFTFCERTGEDKAGCQQSVPVPRVHAPAANVDICMYFAFRQQRQKINNLKEYCIKKHIVSFICRAACKEINKLQVTDKPLSVFFLPFTTTTSCFLCQRQLCTSACQHLGQDKPYAHVTASNLVTRDV